MVNAARSALERDYLPLDIDVRRGKAVYVKSHGRWPGLGLLQCYDKWPIRVVLLPLFACWVNVIVSLNSVFPTTVNDIVCVLVLPPYGQVWWVKRWWKKARMLSTRLPLQAFPRTSCQAEPEKNTTARVFSGSHSSLEMVGANAMRDRWPPADMTASYTARPQAVATRRPWLSYTSVMEHCSRKIFLGVDSSQVRRMQYYFLFSVLVWPT